MEKEQRTTIKLKADWHEIDTPAYQSTTPLSVFAIRAILSSCATDATVHDLS